MHLRATFSGSDGCPWCGHPKVAQTRSASASSWAPSKPSPASATRRLPRTHLGSIGLGHGLFIGNEDEAFYEEGIDKVLSSCEIREGK